MPLRCVYILTENSLPKPKSLDTKVSHSVLAMKSGERDSSSVPSSSPSSSSTSSSLTTPKEHKSAPVIVPLIKPSAGMWATRDVKITGNYPALKYNKCQQNKQMLFHIHTFIYQAHESISSNTPYCNSIHVDKLLTRMCLHPYFDEQCKNCGSCWCRK